MNRLSYASQPAQSLRVPDDRRARTARGILHGPGDPVMVHHPHVLVLGTSRASRTIHAELDKTGIPARRLGSPDEARDAVRQTTRALIIVPPIADVSIAHFCESFRKDHEQLPVFVAVHGTLPRRGARRLYDSGVQAVFEWPADKGPLMRTAFRVAGAISRPKEVGVVGADIALEELINDHLRTASTRFGPGLVAQVKHRYCILTGRVDALWKLHVAEQVASQVQGVDDVVSDGVRVAGPVQTDRAVANAIRQVLKHATEVDPSTLAIRVHKGTVYLTGTAVDREELGRAVQFIQHVRGVRKLENFATVSAKAKLQDREVAKRVAKAIATHHPSLKLDVSVFGGIAVLSGVVKKASERIALEALVAGQEGVERVVDKVRVGRR